MKATISIIILIILSHQVNAQIVWQRCYGGSNGEECNAIRTTFDGGYILAGISASNDGDVSGNHGAGDFWVVKIASSGVIEWQRSYGGSNEDMAFDIQQTKDSGYVVVGKTFSNDGDVIGNHGGQDVWVVKLSSYGAIQWQKCFGGSGDEYANSVKQTTDGGYIVAGTTNSNDGDVTGNHGLSDIWVIKLTDTGSITWTKCYGGSLYEGANTIQQTFDGGYIFGGISNSYDGDVTGYHGSFDIWVVKLSSVGIIEWTRLLGGSLDELGGNVIQTIDSGYIAAGCTYSSNGDVTGHIGSGPSVENGWVVKLSDSGVIQWNKCVYICGSDNINSILQKNDGGYIIVGSTCNNIIGNGNALYGKLSNTGGIEWLDSYGGSKGDFFNSVSLAKDGSCIAAGYTHSNDGDVSGNHGLEDYWVVKFGWHTKVEDVVNSKNVIIAPNPANQYISISASELITDVAITNIVGQVVFSGAYSAEKVQIDVSGMAKGMYFVKVNGAEIRRFIKE